MKFHQRIKDSLYKVTLSKFAAPVVLIGTAYLAFGLLAPTLGFYWDDWPIVYLWKARGDFWQFYLSDRPFMSWPDLAFLSIAGANPLKWQILSLLTRIATVFSFWWCLNLLWPKAKSQNIGTALLFSIYPVFSQHPLAITYKTHFTCLCLYLLSVAFMLLAFRKPRHFVLFLSLALITNAAQLIVLEYFWGLELLRPVLSSVVIAEKNEGWKYHLKKVVRGWLPYLILFCGVIVWRFFILDLAEDRNAPVLLFSLFDTPLSTIGNLSLLALRDSMYLLIGNWLEVFQSRTLDMSSPPMMLLSWGLAILAIAFFWIYLSFVYRKGDDEQKEKPAWPRQALLVGILALLVGMIPVWMTDRQVATGSMYSNRFALPAMVGVSIFIANSLYTFLSKSSHRALVFATLIGLSVGLHFRTANSYRWEWTSQERFYWQLYWRAPAIQPGTSILTGGAFFNYVTKYSLSTAINSLYPAPEETTNLPYWVFELDDINVTSLGDDHRLSGSLRTLTFSSPIENSLLIAYDSTNNSCLWVLSANDSYYQNLYPATREALSLSNLDQILPSPVNSTYPDEDIFGPEPEHTWCYYFEKADLARQLGDWETVSRLGDQAISAGYSPNVLYEWVPFIEGYLHTRNWDQAQALTIEIFNRDLGNRAALCAVWSRSIEGMTLSPVENETVLSVQNELECFLP